ncbi:unnamed protein product, partial [Didymodactylos carnosus]
LKLTFLSLSFKYRVHQYNYSGLLTLRDGGFYMETVLLKSIKTTLQTLQFSIQLTIRDPLNDLIETFKTSDYWKHSHWQIDWDLVDVDCYHFYTIPFAFTHLSSLKMDEKKIHCNFSSNVRSVTITHPQEMCKTSLLKNLNHVHIRIGRRDSNKLFIEPERDFSVTTRGVTIETNDVVFSFEKTLQLIINCYNMNNLQHFVTSGTNLSNLFRNESCISLAVIDLFNNVKQLKLLGSDLKMIDISRYFRQLQILIFIKQRSKSFEFDINNEMTVLARDMKQLIYLDICSVIHVLHATILNFNPDYDRSIIEQIMMQHNRFPYHLEIQPERMRLQLTQKEPFSVGSQR